MIEKESEILSKLNHPNITKFIGSYKINDSECLILEYCKNGDLGSYLNETFIEKKLFIEEKIILKIFAQLVLAIEYLHTEAKIIHRDVKGLNVLVSDGVFKLADFGVSIEKNNEV